MFNDGKTVNNANGEITAVTKRVFGERFRKLRGIWCIFETLKVYCEFVDLSGVFGEITVKLKVDVLIHQFLF